MLNFDIILPTIGRDSLPEAIKSVFRQTHQGFRLWIVCDGWQLPEEFERLPCNVFFMYVEGPGDDYGAFARNCAMKDIMRVSENNWVAYIDDDDEWLPHHLETLASLAEANADANMMRTAGQSFMMKHKHPRSSKLVRKMGAVNTTDILTVGMAHTRAIFDETDGWQTGTAHDKDLWNAMLSAGGKAQKTNDVTFVFKR